MLPLIQSIQPTRLLLALSMTFLMADTYPHPNLGPGVLETLVQQMHHQVLQVSNRR